MKYSNRHLDLARAACDHAVSLAEKFNQQISVVVVDRAGRTIAAMRTDQASYTSMEPARRKAVASASFQFPTTVLTEISASDPVAARALQASDDLLAVPGGIPLLLDGKCIGAFGIAGGHYGDDQMIAEKVRDALGQPAEQDDD